MMIHRQIRVAIRFTGHAAETTGDGYLGVSREIKIKACDERYHARVEDCEYGYRPTHRNNLPRIYATNNDTYHSAHPEAHREFWSAVRHVDLFPRTSDEAPSEAHFRIWSFDIASGTSRLEIKKGSRSKAQ